MTEIVLVAAMAKNRVIGLSNKMPWHLPADLKHFKAVTIGKPIVMGRKTRLSIGVALPGRKNIVLTRDKQFKANNCYVAYNPEQALASAEHSDQVMIVGGAEIYQLFLSRAHRMYLTYIDLAVDGDTYFPEFSHDEWQTVAETEGLVDEKNRLKHRFVELERVKSSPTDQ